MTPIQNNSLYNLSNTLLSGYSSINNMRLSQALSTSGAYGKSSAISSILPVQSSFDTDTAKFLESYNTKMTDLQTAATNAMNPKDSNKLTAGTTNSSVISASGSMSKISDKFDITVEQLASGQVNRSIEMSSTGTMPSFGGALKIQTAAGSKEIYLSSAGAKTNAEALKNFADKINAAGTGVTAKMVEKDGKASLELTGADKDFSVSGSLADRLSLNQVAQQRQNAVYSISKNGGTATQYMSSTNNINIEGTLTAQLKDVGKATVKSGRSEADVTADALEKLVTSYNDSLKLLNQNSDRGLGVLRQIKRMILPPTSERSMQMAGVSIAKDGSLSFDRTKFTEAMERDPSLTRVIVNSIARGVQDDAKRGLQESSFSLVGQQTNSKSAYGLDSIGLMSLYNRTGAYNSSNLYAVGALLNISF